MAAIVGISGICQVEFGRVLAAKPPVRGVIDHREIKVFPAHRFPLGNTCLILLDNNLPCAGWFIKAFGEAARRQARLSKRARENIWLVLPADTVRLTVSAPSGRQSWTA